MKKYILSALLILTFGTYAIYVRFGDKGLIGNLPVIADNTSIPTNPNNIGNTSTVKSQTVARPRYSDDDEEDDGYFATAQRNTSPVPVTTPTKTVTTVPANTMMNNMMSIYKDGTYTGDSLFVVDDNMQVAVTISGGRITDITFPVYPQNSGQTRMINDNALPILKQEAIQAQSATVDAVSGATYSSLVFGQSLGSALALAKK